MAKPVIVTLIASTTFVAGAAFFGTAQAGSLLGGNGFSNQSYKQQVILEEERRRARAVGGYNDPITALRNLFAGQLTEKDVSPGVNTIYDTPKHGTSLLRGRF